MNMLKPLFTLLFALTSVLLFAQTDNKSTHPNANRTIVKEGVKMYELKVDSNSGVVIIDPKSEKGDAKRNKSTTPLTKDTTKSKP
jgi:hypothetical protein